MTFGAILTGFTGTMLGVLLGLRSDLMTVIRATDGAMDQLDQYIKMALFADLLLGSIGMLGLAIGGAWPEGMDSMPHWLGNAAWLFAAVFCVLCYGRLSTLIMDMFLHRLSKV